MDKFKVLNVAIVQMRLGSQRLPAKMLLDLGGWRVWQWVCHAVEASEVDLVIYAIPIGDKGSELDFELSRRKSERVSIFYGDENDVFSRFQGALQKVRSLNPHQQIALIRVCADRPLISTKNLNILISSNLSGLSFNHHDGFGRFTGFGAERLSPDLTSALFFAKYTQFKSSEHVTQCLYANDFIVTKRCWHKKVWRSVQCIPDQKLDLDCEADLIRLRDWVTMNKLSPVGSVENGI